MSVETLIALSKESADDSVSRSSLQFKPYKSLDEQLHILIENKNVQFNIISQDDAKEILFRYNYINVISPFKYHFAEKSKLDPNVLVKIDGKHQYPQEVDFSLYSSKYFGERNKYVVIFQKIMSFETSFNSILSYCVINEYRIDSLDEFDTFILDIQCRALMLQVSSARKNHMISEINDFRRQVIEYHNCIVFFDRLSFGNLLTIFMCLDKKLKTIILKDLVSRDLSLGYTDIQTFEQKIFTLVSIRNCICHNNSLEILVRYFDIKRNILRDSSDRKKFTNLIGKLVDE